MTHVSGHVGRPDKSFGILLPVKIGNGGGWNAEPFPILFTGCENAHFKIGDHVAFHPYIVPWCKDSDKFFVIAGDVVSLEEHQNAERDLKEVTGNNKKVEEWGMSEESILELEHKAKDERLAKHKQILLTSCRYMRSESFRTFYNPDNLASSNGTNDAIVNWITRKGVRLHETGFDNLKGTTIDADLGKLLLGELEEHNLA